MAEMVEHQATVETGLKMKIKRKNPTQKTSAELRCKAAAAGSEDKNGNIKSRKTKPDNREVAGDFAPTTQTTEEKLSEETLKEPEERPQKRKRNAKSIRQTTIQNGVDYEVTKGNKSKPDSDSHSKAQVTSAKDKPKNGKICPPEKASRKRAASVCAVVPVVSSCETPKAKSLRITTYDKDTVIEEKNTDCRKPGYSGMKTDTEDSPRKAESKSSQQPQPHGEIPSQAALSLRGGGDDPYEFVAKVEDVIQTPIKKFKSDKADLTSFPAEPFLSAAAVAGVGTVGGGGHHDIATETCSIGVTTDPDCLGPCEPGTSVILEGIVWSESNNGILVVNVTWRGKTYVGTLMDTTKHHWASPRFRDDSPIPEIDWRSPKSKRTSGTTPVVEVLEGRRLRNSRQRNIPAAANGCTSSSSLKGTSNTLRVQSPVQLEANNGRRRAQRMADNADMTTSSSNCIMTQPLKKTRPAMTNENDGEDPLLECTLLNCNKKFKHISGLNYHQSHAHRKTLVDESKPGSGKVPSAAMDGNLEATFSTETRETEVTHEENANCGVESTDVVVPVTDEVDLAGSRAQSDCSMNKSVCSVVNLPVSLSIASSCTSGAPVVDASGPGFDGKHPQKIKNNHAYSPPPRPSKPVEEEPSSESEQSSGLSRSPPLRQVPPPPPPPPPPPQDFKPNDGGKSLRASDAEKNLLAETKINGSPTPLVLSSKSPSNSSHHPLPVGSDDKEGRSCVIPSTGDHQSQSETPTTGPPGLSASAVTNVSSSPLASSFSSSSGFLIGADNKSPNYSDISDSAEFISGQMDYSRANGHQPQQQGKDGATRKQQRPMFDSRQQKSKQETTGAAQSHSSSTSGVSALPHLSVPQSNGNHVGNDAVRQQKMKDPSAAKETIDSSSAAANSSYTKPATPEEKPAISQIAYHADAADAQAKEHRLWLENLHHQHHQNSAIASSMAMASSAAAAMNMMPYGYGLDQAAYHLQFLSQNPETRSHYERWLMEQSHYLQQQQQHHHQQQQQQRCFSKLMQVEAERGPPSSDSKPVDMTSKGSIHPSNDSTASGLAPPFGGKPKGGRVGDGRPADSANKPLHKSTIALEANSDWMSASVRHSHSIPSVNGIADSCGDSRRTTTAQPSGRNNASKEKLDGVKPPDQFHKGGKDALWERNERVVMNKEMGSPDDLTGGSSHLTPISKASNSVGNISPYSSGGLLKNLVFQDSSHQQSPPIGYSPSASFMEMSSSEAATSISPNSKFLDLDSKQVVTGSNLRRSGDGRHALDVLRYQSAMYGKQSSTAAEHLGSNGPKHNRSTLSKDFLEEPGHSKDGKGSPSGHSSPLTLRHLHTHHHTHVVGAAYPIYGSYNGLMSPVPAIVPSGPPVIAPTYLPK